MTMVEIRQMQPEDLTSVMTIERECFTMPWRESSYLAELSNRSAHYLVACIDSVIVGFCGEWVIMDEAHITTLGVASQYRGQRIGEQLLIALLEQAMRHNARRATLEVRKSNLVAQQLYIKYGFRTAAVRRGYYTDNGEDALVMWVDNLSTLEYGDKLDELKQNLWQSVQSA
ncbi:MAG: ribosomal protein S18-alanine N-acetyltransferase [Armatimonadetes bacterium]|jgi:ribosomal-protein-alanine N-acetyltransferase|nr:ribosomal protein S18-alanine N-acetyltransferase [Armatimonadota bacterium]